MGTPGPRPPLAPAPCRLPSSHSLDLKQLHVCVVPDRWVHIPAERVDGHLGAGRPQGNVFQQQGESLLKRSHRGERHCPPDTLDGCLRRCAAEGSMLPFLSASSAHLTWAESRLQTNWPQERGAGEAEPTCRPKSGVGLRTASPAPRPTLLSPREHSCSLGWRRLGFILTSTQLWGMAPGSVAH